MMVKRLREYINNWMASRSKPAYSIKLVHRNCYIFPNRYGLLFIVLLFIMLIGATNYQNNLAFTLTFLLTSMGLIGIFLTFRNLVGLNIKCGSAEPVFAGDDMIFPVYLRSEHRNHFAVGIGIDRDIQKYADVEIDKASEVLLQEKAIRRGILKLGRVRLTTKFPLGMLRCWTLVPLVLEGLVYPKPIEPKLYMNSSHLDEDGAEVKTGSDDFDQIRNYQKGDSIKHVDWKAFARERGLYTKQFSEPVGESSLIEWDDFDTHDPELKLSYMCYLVLAADKEQKKIGIVIPGERIEPNIGKDHVQKCLKALAMYEN